MTNADPSEHNLPVVAAQDALAFAYQVSPEQAIIIRMLTLDSMATLFSATSR